MPSTPGHSVCISLQDENGDHRGWLKKQTYTKVILPVWTEIYGKLEISDAVITCTVTELGQRWNTWDTRLGVNREFCRGYASVTY
ncbi:hypothetical protein F4804DRAFT_324352 [Jackrogersella minutella]|nr:hypothetical protein F4804DRAFT_324352 [Jackrogersella minutella]